jgi:hypothetical protein
MSQPRDDRQDDLFRPSLEKIINLRHPLMRLAAEIDVLLRRGLQLLSGKPTGGLWQREVAPHPAATLGG